MQALSTDHEFLTKEGWKRNVTTEDELAIFSHPFQFVKPTKVTTTPYSDDLIFIENARINIFGTPGLMIHSTEPTTLLDCVHSMGPNAPHHGITFKVAHPTFTPDLAGISKKCNEYEAEATMMLALTNGCHASIAKIPYSLDPDVYCKTYGDDVVIDHETEVIHLSNNRGSSVIQIMLPSPQPICIRRYGKCCWIMSTAAVPP